MMSRRYSYFLGCVMPIKMPWAESATIQSLRYLGVDVNYLEGGLCCPRPGVWVSFDNNAWITFAANNLVKAEKEGRDTLVSCNGCYSTLYEALNVLKNDPAKLALVNENLSEIGLHFNASNEVRHLLEVLCEDVGTATLAKGKKLGLRVAIHRGCHIRSHPRLLDYFVDILGAIGVEIVPYDLEQMCCGLPGMLTDPQFGIYERSKRKMESVNALNVDAWVITCSGCYDQYDRALRHLMGEGFALNTPIVHISELVALSLGFSPEDFGMMYTRPVTTDPLINKLSDNGIISSSRAYAGRIQI
ncbi:MAG: heterodisulfide reductase-related iron-sulfur binding cluster [Halobacteriota archaeon]